MKALLSVQGLYYALTALWPLIHMESFLFVSGPKTDLWLVKTFSVVLLCEGIGFLIAGLRREHAQSVYWFALSNATSLLWIDIYYSMAGLIRKIYLLDAAVQSLLLIAWLLLLFRKK
jgi:hypothetical protein